MSPERSKFVITTPGKREHSDVLLADAMAKAGFDIRVSDLFEVIGNKKTQDVFFDLSGTPEMTLVFWAIHGLDARSLGNPAFEDNANFLSHTKEQLSTLALKRNLANRKRSAEPLSVEELDMLQELVYRFVEQQLKKRTY